MVEKKQKKNWSYYFCRKLCVLYCKLFCRFKVHSLENLPPDTGFLLICNHQSFLDPLFCGVPYKGHLHFMARSTLYKGAFGNLIKSFDTIPVKRGESDIKAMKLIIKKLKESKAVCLYPEGTRCTDGKVAEFKPGFGLLARRSKVPIIPAAIEGAHEIWPRGRKFPALFREVRIKYGEMITSQEINSLTDEELAQKVTSTVRNMQNELREKMGRPVIDY